jgi:nifR3 family TIM-barrel protein
MSYSGIRIEKELILAPMAGFTHSAFRRLCRRLGADRVYSELMNATGIVRKGEKRELAYFTQEERPIHLQIYGANPEDMAESASTLAKRYAPDAIDLNFGCPARKVLKSRAGGYLLRFPDMVRRIAEAVVETLKPLGVPVTAKIRLGFDEDRLEDIAEALLKAGVSAISLHPRLVVEGFSGCARWQRVKELKKMAGNIPIIGSGDIKNWQEIDRKFAETGCDGVMLGRSALRNPWIFKEYREKEGVNAGISERADFILKELELMWEFFSKEKACRVIKAHISQIFKGVNGRKTIIGSALRATNCLALVDLLRKLKS